MTQRLCCWALLLTLWFVEPETKLRLSVNPPTGIAPLDVRVVASATNVDPRFTELTLLALDDGAEDDAMAVVHRTSADLPGKWYTPDERPDTQPGVFLERTWTFPTGEYTLKACLTGRREALCADRPLRVR